MDNFKTK